MKSYKQKLAYIALGGVLMLMGMIASSVLMPSLFAQRDNFEHIQCNSLRIVDNEGAPKVWIGGALGRVSLDSGTIIVNGKDSAGVQIGCDTNGNGIVEIFGKGNGKATIGINEFGNGSMSTYDKNGNQQ